MTDGSGTIDVGGCIASISGQSMAAAPAWDGTITVEDSIGRIAIGSGLAAKAFAEVIKTETMELVQRSYSDQMGKVMIGGFCMPVE